MNYKRTATHNTSITQIKVDSDRNEKIVNNQSFVSYQANHFAGCAQLITNFFTFVVYVISI